ncbi:MAG TPA: class I SAM-dependent methyltransferase [Pseudonocardia sp.]|nr:class I SAM-dependent methyltransferase [Pseudonocardia sp.]
MTDEALTVTNKADFSAIYGQPDPRAYFRALVPLDYQVPQRALPIFEAVLAESGSRTVLDVCCSYGINGALLRYDVDLAGIGARAADPARAGLAPDAVIRDDAAFYAPRLRRPDLSVVGLDASAPAIGYGVRTGLLAGGWAEDLEAADPSPALVAGLREVDLVVCTGGVGYIGERTFDRILGAVPVPARLWLATFVLRVFDFAPIADTLGRYGLVTERVPGVTFRQRRFADRDEADAARYDVLARGLDPAGKEADGWFHADCYLTRPAATAAATPISTLLRGVLPAR